MPSKVGSAFQENYEKKIQFWYLITLDSDRIVFQFNFPLKFMSPLPVNFFTQSCNFYLLFVTFTFRKLLSQLSDSSSNSNWNKKKIKDWIKDILGLWLVKTKLWTGFFRMEKLTKPRMGDLFITTLGLQKTQRFKDPLLRRILVPGLV